MQLPFGKNKVKKAVSLLLCAVMATGLAACGNSESSSTSAAQAPSTQPAASSEVADETPALEVAFLTGLEKGEDYPEGKRFVAVMVNNIAASRPTRGLSEAQMLFEIKVEGGITRFMALFENYETMPEVGSVRSARDQFFQLILPFQPFYMHEGPSSSTHPLNIMMNTYNYSDFDLQQGYYSGLAWRDTTRNMATEYTLYTDGEHITDVINSYDLDTSRTYNSPIFSFVPYTEEARTLDGGTATEVAIVHSDSYRTSFNYENGRYYMSQYSSAGVTATIDENNGEQVAFDNVLVLFAPMTLYNASELVKVDYYGGGGYYISNGTWEPILWEKGAPDSPLQLKTIDQSGDAVQINPGTTYVAVVDDSLIGDFDTSIRANSADAAVGVADTNETDVD